MKIEHKLKSFLVENKLIFDRQMFFVLAFGLIVFGVNLAISLDLLSSFLLLMIFVALAIFGKSFSRGWLFLLGVSLIFPFLKIGENIFLFNLILLALVIVSLIQFGFEKNKFFVDKISFYFFAFILVAVSLIVFGKIFGGEIRTQFYQIFFSLALFWVLLFLFQYFFQTRKRIRRFFWLICLTATMHSFFGLVAFFLNYQTSSGAGISFASTGTLFLADFSKQISGFFGTNMANLIGQNFLSSFLSVAIIFSIGLLIYYLKYFSKNEKNDESRILRIKLVLVFLVIQILGIIFTFSYTSIISTLAGVLIIGIILRNNRLIFSGVSLIFVLSFVLPSLPFFNNTSFFFNVGEIARFSKDWLLGSGVIFSENGMSSSSGSVFNSYFLIWKYFGIFGITIFLGIISRFFIDIYQSYKKSQGQERLILTIISGAFVVMILEGLYGNTLIFGPTAVVFWLLCAITLNLKNNLIPASFILKSGIFGNSLGFFVNQNEKNFDGIKKMLNFDLRRKRMKAERNL